MEPRIFHPPAEEGNSRISHVALVTNGWEPSGMSVLRRGGSRGGKYGVRTVLERMHDADDGEEETRKILRPIGNPRVSSDALFAAENVEPAERTDTRVNQSIKLSASPRPTDDETNPPSNTTDAEVPEGVKTFKSSVIMAAPLPSSSPICILNFISPFVSETVSALAAVTAIAESA